MEGLALQRLGRRADARAALDRAAAITETYVDVHVALGILDFTEGRAAEARGPLRARARRSDPAGASASCRCGSIARDGFGAMTPRLRGRRPDCRGRCSGS